MDMLHWKLRDFLKSRNIPTLKLEKASTISRVTLYRLTSPDPKRQQHRIDFPTLTALIAALRKITGEDVTPNDLLEFVPAPEPRGDEDEAWLGADLGGLERYEPYDWCEGELEGGTPLQYVAGQGWIRG